MEKLAKTAYCSLLLFLLAMEVAGRPLLGYHASDSVSDGLDTVPANRSSFLLLGRGGEEVSEDCEQMYGFLPCSYSPLGHLFLIVLYEYLLYHGESYVVSGGERIFQILGPGIFGASAFHVLGSLPEALILLASGLLYSKETAQEYVYTGVGLLTGSTILLLTLLWGTCVILGSRNLSTDSKSNPSISSNPKLLSFLTGYGITTDLETSYTARIMVLSLVPFLIIQIPKVFQLSSSGQRVFIMITLVTSVAFLLLYFFYQIFEPWIQNRRLDYMKHKHLVLDILKHVQRHAMGRLVSEDGSPNLMAIRRLFEEVDEDGDRNISFAELRQLLQEIKYKRSHADKDRVVAEVMKEFDLDGNRKITIDEFVSGFTKWLDETKRSMDKQYHSVRSLKDLYQILRPWIQKRRREHEMKEQLISEILAHVQSSAIGRLFMEDGKPDIPAIKRLFESIDLDKDNSISQSELKELVVNIKFRSMPLDADEAVEKLMEELDVSGDQMINEEEFVAGCSKWLNIVNNQAPNPTTASEEQLYQRKWEETDSLVGDRSTVYRSPWAWMKAIMLLLVGISILGVLAEPLIQSVQNFSKSAKIPSFFISCVSPIGYQCQGCNISHHCCKSQEAENHFFDILRVCDKLRLLVMQVYGGVFMNNMLGFSVLLSLVYFRAFPWDFSAEVLIVLIVCGVMGVAASLSSSFPIWTSMVAFLLYPFSLILVLVLHDSVQ